jgi:energy-coupling factor transporter transmembrane protein EcfT
VNAEPTLVVDPFITIAFYVGAVVTLIFVGFKVLIIPFKPKAGVIVLWTIYGLMLLFAWFQVFQPIFYNMGWTDAESSLTRLAQGQPSNAAIDQLFLVAAPETLIFQILFIGVGNRLYFYFDKTRILQKEEKRIKAERWDLARQQVILRNDLVPKTRNTKKNLVEIVGILVKMAAIRQKYEDLTLRLERNKI